MKRTLIEIYALAVCFVALICAIITLGVGIYDFIEIANPKFTLSSHQYEQHQSNDAYFENDCKEGDKVAITEEEKTKKRLASFERALDSERRDAFQSLTRAVIILLIDAFVFLIHWRIARNARENNNIA
jgi:hypothetical protein